MGNSLNSMLFACNSSAPVNSNSNLSLNSLSAVGGGGGVSLTGGLATGSAGKNSLNSSHSGLIKGDLDSTLASLASNLDLKPRKSNVKF
jgi:hypothetical protein